MDDRSVRLKKRKYGLVQTEKASQRERMELKWLLLVTNETYQLYLIASKYLDLRDVRYRSRQALWLRTSFARLGDGMAYDYHDALCKYFSLVVDSRKLRIERARGQLDRKHVKLAMHQI